MTPNFFNMKNEKYYLIRKTNFFFTILFFFSIFFSQNSIAQNCSVNAGVPQLVCATNTITLTGGKTGLFQTGVTTWQQIQGPTAIITNPSNLTTTVTSILGGYTYKFRLSTTCLDGSLVYDDVDVTVFAANFANAGPNKAICPGANTANLEGNTLQAGEVGVWSIIGANNASITVANNALPNSLISATANDGGLSTLRWTVTNTAGCVSTDDVVITNKGGVSPVTAGIDRVASACFTSTTSAQASGASRGGTSGAGQIGTWSVVSGPSIPTYSGVNAYNCTFSNLIEGTYIMRWTVSGSCVNGFDDMTITVPAPSVGVTTSSITNPSGDISYCDGRTSVVLTGSIPVNAGETVLWTKTAGLAGDIIQSPTNYTTQVTNLNNTSSYSYRYTVTNSSGCSSSSTRNIYWTTPPVFNFTSANPLNVACGANSATVTYAQSGSGTLQWRILSGPVTPTYSVIPTAWSNAYASGTAIPGFTVPGTYQIQYRKSSGTISQCESVYKDYVVVVASSPTLSNAGTDQILACNIFTTNLVGNIPSVGNGKWYQIAGPNSATLTSPNANICPISGLISGRYTFRWLISSGPQCIDSQDDVYVTVADPIPTAAAAGSDITVCKSTPIYLEGNMPKLNETGLWTVFPSSGVTLTNPTSSNVIANGLAANTSYTFTWTISNACGISDDHVIITTSNTAGPSESNAGLDQCLPSGTTLITQNANNPLLGVGTWYKILGGVATITNPLSNSTTVTGMADGIYQFEWVITNNGCLPTRDTVKVTISPPATMPNAGIDQSVCGTDVTLAGNVPTIGSGNWSQILGPGGAIITNSNLPNSTVTNMSNGSYVFRWTISNQNCNSNYDDVKIIVANPPTTPNAGSDISLCSTTTATMAANIITTGNGWWSSVSGPNTPTFTSVNSPTTTVTSLISGTYILRWNSFNGSACPISTDDVFVYVSLAANAGISQSLCSTPSASLTGTANTSGVWTQVGVLPNVATINSVTPSTAIATGLINGIYTFNYSIPVIGTCPSTNSNVLVTISSPPNQANAGPDQNLCDISSITMAGNAISIGAPATSVWTKRSGPAGGAITTSTSPVTSITGLTAGTYYYLWTFTNGGCVTQDEVKIVSNSSGTIANAGPDQNNVCATSVTLAAVAPTTGVGTWSLVSGPNTPTFSSYILPTANISNLIPGTYVLRWSITNGLCAASTDDVTLVILGPPTITNAGVDQNICNVNSITLTGNNIIVGTGVWSKISGPAGSVITDNMNPVTTVTGLIPGTYIFAWTSTNGICSSTDNVQIRIYDNSTISNAGTDQNICLFSNINLASNTPTVGIGTWTQITGNPAVINNPASPTTLITGITAGSYGFRWTISNGNCPISTDDVLVVVNANPSISNAGPDQSVCATIATLAGNTPVLGIGTWIITSGVGGIVNEPNNPNSLFTGNAGNTYTLKWVIDNNPCTSSEDFVNVTFGTNTIVVDAGPDQNICGTSTVLQGNDPIPDVGTWSVISGAGGSFLDLHNPSTTFTGTQGVSYILKWSFTKNSCYVFDEVIINFALPPTVANAGIDQTSASMCGLTVTVLNANNPTNGTGFWSILSGIGGIELLRLLSRHQLCMHEFVSLYSV